jgi:hypothetical protein
MRTVVVKNGAKLLDDKAAMMIPATQGDRWRVGDGWASGLDGWAHGTLVDEVTHFRKHRTRVGEVLTIRDLDSMEIVCQVQVIEMRMVVSDQLTGDDLVESGHGTREVLVADIGPGARKMWYIKVTTENIPEWYSGGSSLVQ